MAFRLTKRKCIFLTCATTIMTTFFMMVANPPKYPEELIVKEEKNWRGLDARQTKNFSVLGRILFLEEDEPKIEIREKKYKILVWKYARYIERRHLKQFRDKLLDPFRHCSVKNCLVTYSDQYLNTADLVLFHLHRMQKNELPHRPNSQQIWAFMTDESPFNTFLDRTNALNYYNGKFNWSMTYRMNSDIPVSYGRTLRKGHPSEEPHPEKQRQVLIAIMGSNCQSFNKRWEYVAELQKHIAVDVYGLCGTKTCPGHIDHNCPLLDHYMFYLAFENSNCDEYVTEKLWWNAYHKNSIPIVMGASKDSYRQLLPPNSYLNVEDFAHPKDLANYVLYLNSTGRYKDLYEWKRNFRVVQEHGYFGSESYHYCRACEALNYNDRREKTYDDLSTFWDVKRDCSPPQF